MDKLKPVYGRPPASVKAAALRALAEANPEWSMDAFLVACLATLGKSPAEILALVAPNRIEPRPQGRPPKGEAPEAKPARKKAAPKKAEPEPSSFSSATEPKRLPLAGRRTDPLPFNPSPRPSQAKRRPSGH